MKRKKKLNPSVNSRREDSRWDASALRALVEARGLAPEDLAARTKRRAETARRWLAGRTIPNLEEGRAIADLLEVDVVELLAGEADGVSGSSSSRHGAGN